MFSQRFVYTFMCTHDDDGLSYTRDLLRNDLMVKLNVAFFSRLKNGELTRKVERMNPTGYLG